MEQENGTEQTPDETPKKKKKKKSKTAEATNNQEAVETPKKKKKKASKDWYRSIYYTRLEYVYQLCTIPMYWLHSLF